MVSAGVNSSAVGFECGQFSQRRDCATAADDEKHMDARVFRMAARKSNWLLFLLGGEKQSPPSYLAETATTVISLPTKTESQSDLTLSAPPSTCPHCQHHIRFYENIPIISYILLGGKCSNCQQTISWRYPLIEALTALLTLIVALQFGMTSQLPAALLLTWALIALALIDYDHQLLPDNITLPLLWLGLFLNLFDIFTDSQSALIGAIAGYLSLWLVFQLFRLLTGKEGMGYGDFKLLAVFGAWLGWQLLPQIVLMATVAGASYGVILLITGQQQRAQPLPLAHF